MPELANENLAAQRAWDTNASFWDQRMGEGNEFFNLLVWPAVEQLLQPRKGDTLLDVACGNGLTSRRLAEAGASVLAFDFSEEMIRQARERSRGQEIDYRILDATDPSAIGNATAALGAITGALNRDLPPVMRASATGPAPFQFVVHARYNPEQLTVLNIVPGLICIVLMMSTLFMTTLSITKERERGTMENLLAMPVRPIEVMVAKMVPYVFIGYIQVLLVLVASALFFHLPLRGSLVTLLGALGLFIGGNLALGITFSTVSANQMQAIQFAQFTLMPSFMLSGFMFPFRGMPQWAQWVGEVFPTTHAMRIVRGVLLKGNATPEILPELWPIAAFMAATIAIAIWSYRETLE